VARTTGPLHCLSAAGTLVPGVTFRRRGGLTIIERTPYHAVKPTQASIANQTIIQCLTAWWHKTTAPGRFGWDALSPGYAPTPYHAFLKFNLRRIWAGKTPSNYYPPSEVPPAGNISGFGCFPTSNHVRFFVNSDSTHLRWCDIVWRTRTIPTVRSPHTLVGVWLKTGLYGYGVGWHDDFHVAAGLWHYYATSMSRDFGPYPGLGWYSVTVPG